MKTLEMKLQRLERMAPEPSDQTPHTDQEYIAAVERVLEALNTGFRVPPDEQKALSEKRKRQLIRQRRAMDNLNTVQEIRDHIFRA